MKLYKLKSNEVIQSIILTIYKYILVKPDGNWKHNSLMASYDLRVYYIVLPVEKTNPISYIYVFTLSSSLI